MYILGGERRILRAGMRCTGPQPTIVLASPYMSAYKANFSGVAFASSSCNGTSRNSSSCLVTICAGRLVLRRSSVSWVRGIPLETVVCVVGDSMLEVQQSRFSRNRARALAIFDQARVLLNASAVTNNSIIGSGGGMWIEGRANVTITGRSRVHGNTAFYYEEDDVCHHRACTGLGGGLVARGFATLTVDGNSTVSGNNAKYGGGLAAYENARAMLSGASRVHGNTATAGGLYVSGNATVMLTGGSSVYNNTQGLWVVGNAIVTLTGGSSVHHNRHPEDNETFGKGGGLYIENDATVMLTGGSSVHSNAAVFGGGLWARGNLTLTGGSSVHNNMAGAGGGLFAGSGATVTITGGSFVHNNTAVNAGGGLRVENATVVLTGGSSVHGNRALKGSGGGLTVLTGARVTISDMRTVVGNSCARGVGGGMAVDVDVEGVVGGAAFDARGRVVAVEDEGPGAVEWDVPDEPPGPPNSTARIAGKKPSSVDSNTPSVDAMDDTTSVDNMDNTTFTPYMDHTTSDEYMDDTASDDGVSSTAPQSVETIRSAVGVPSLVTISNSSVTNNTSIKTAGGGLAVWRNGTAELLNGTVLSYNTVVNGSGGGVLLLDYATLHVDGSVKIDNNIVSKGFVGSTVAAFGSSKLILPVHGHFTKCRTGVYLGQDTCQTGEVMQHDVCVCCPQHTFSFTNASCEPCPPNGNCTGGSIVQPLPGYWSSAPTSVQMHRCPLSTTACNFISPDHQCNEGYTGPLCGACQLPHHGMLGPFECGKCMNPNVQLGLYLSMSGGSVFVVTYTVHATWRDNLTGDKVVLATDMIKVLVQFLQYTAIIGSVSVPWPLFNLKRWFQAVNIPFAGSTGQSLSLDCWLVAIPSKLPLAMQRQLVYFLAPVFVLLAVVALLWLFWVLGRWVVPLVRRPKEGSTPQPAMSFVRKMPITLMVVAFYSYPTLLRASLSLFACLRIDRLPNPRDDTFKLPPGATAPLNHTAGYWVSDIAQQCFAGYHKGWALGLGLPSIILWCLAVPVAMGVGLFLCRAKADEDSFREHFGFLYRSYKPERMWWEAVWAARTVVLTLISVFAIPMERYYAVLSLLVVFLVSAVLQNVFKPYAFATLHHMHKLSTSCLAATTLGALAILYIKRI